ncbi:MAG: CvpA family protein [Caldilineaceae bacterium]|nr:CvpA family protein [Caldilineaceae bacterium]
MGPIEVLFITIQIIIAAIGMVRGYAKELGNTLVFMVVIFLLAYFGDRAESILTSFGQLVFGIVPDSNDMRAFLFAMYVAVFLSVVFASYAGRTLDFPGKQMPPPQGSLLSLLIGLLNGYLVAGTLWFYADKYSYPLLNVNTDQFSPTAELMLQYLPQTVAANPVAWMVPVALLILLRVRG